MLSPSGPHYLDLGQGLPLGIEPSSYVSTSTFLAPGATLLAFTDGLVERRGESIEMGLRRLAKAATSPAGTLDDLISSLIDQLAESGAEDDIAVLALKWRGTQQTS